MAQKYADVIQHSPRVLTFIFGFCSHRVYNAGFQMLRVVMLPDGTGEKESPLSHDGWRMDYTEVPISWPPRSPDLIPLDFSCGVV